MIALSFGLLASNNSATRGNTPVICLVFDVSEDLVGGIAYDTHGTPLHDSTLAKAQEVDAVLLGAVG